MIHTTNSNNCVTSKLPCCRSSSSLLFSLFSNVLSFMEGGDTNVKLLTEMIHEEIDDGLMD